MFSMEVRNCKFCKEKFLIRGKSKFKCIHGAKKCLNFTEQNYMDPGRVPNELLGLSYIEEQLIARVHAVVSVTKLKGHQYGYSGNVINFAQDVKSFAKKLPHNIKELGSVINIKTSGDLNLKPKQFQVRAGKVKEALLWLKEHNPFYYDIDICESNLEMLPEDDNVYKDVMSVDSGEKHELNIEEQGAKPTMDEHECEEVDGDVDDIYETGVPLM
jgi:hypothetical protein